VGQRKVDFTNSDPAFLTNLLRRNFKNRRTVPWFFRSDFNLQSLSRSLPGDGCLGSEQFYGSNLAGIESGAFRQAGHTDYTVCRPVQGVNGGRKVRRVALGGAAVEKCSTFTLKMEDVHQYGRMGRNTSAGQSRGG
jgi:hypothetical protein